MCRVPCATNTLAAHAAAAHVVPYQWCAGVPRAANAKSPSFFSVHFYIRKFCAIRSTSLTKLYRNHLSRLLPPLKPPNADAHISATVGPIDPKFEPNVRQQPSLDHPCHRRRSPSIATVALRRQLHITNGWAPSAPPPSLPQLCHMIQTTTT